MIIDVNPTYFAIFNHPGIEGFSSNRMLLHHWDRLAFCISFIHIHSRLTMIRHGSTLLKPPKTRSFVLRRLTGIKPVVRNCFLERFGNPTHKFRNKWSLSLLESSNQTCSDILGGRTQQFFFVLPSLNLLAPPVKNRWSPPRPGFIYDEISDVEGVKVATRGWWLVSVSGGSWVLLICLAFLREIQVFLAILNFPWDSTGGNFPHSRRENFSCTKELLFGFFMIFL